MKNTQPAIKRLLKAKKEGEKIGIWGDYDPDGVCGATMLYEALLEAGFLKNNLFVVLPHLKQYGRSFNPHHLLMLKKHLVSLIVGIDFGTSDFPRVQMAKNMGFDLILLDHHVQLPGKVLVTLINPKQKNDPYPHKNWSATGVVYKFLEEFYKQLSIHAKRLEKTLDLLAIGMMADRTKKDKANLPYLKKGVALINQKKRLGLKVLMDVGGFKKVTLPILEGPFIDYVGSLEGNDTQNNLFCLLTTGQKNVAAQIAENINKKVKTLLRVTQKGIRQGIKKFSKIKNLKVIIWEQNPKIISAVSIIAENLNKYFKAPVFMYEKVNGQYKGSVRTVYSPRIDAVEALKSCAQLLKSYGGHPVAAGFRIAEKNLPEFKKAIEKYCE